MGYVWTDVHQMRNTLTTLPFSITLKEFAHLEEEHYKDCLRKLRLSSWQEADAESAYGGYGHQEMLVEGVALHQAFSSLLQRACSDDEIRDKIDQQQLPRGECRCFLYDYCSYKQYHCCHNDSQLSVQPMLMMMLMTTAFTLMFVMMFVSHILNVLLFLRAKVRNLFCNLVAN